MYLCFIDIFHTYLASTHTILYFVFVFVLFIIDTCYRNPFPPGNSSSLSNLDSLPKNNDCKYMHWQIYLMANIFSSKYEYLQIYILANICTTKLCNSKYMPPLQKLQCRNTQLGINRREANKIGWVRWENYVRQKSFLIQSI